MISNGSSNIANENPIDYYELREQLLTALNGSNGQSRTKEVIREIHIAQRRERSQAEARLLSRYGREILSYFAEGSDVDPSKIDPQLVLIKNPTSLDGYLFRAAALLWSVPVSKGYGRRMRYLVVDRQNNKLIGLLALGDPVFNLRCRDEWIGWSVNERRERLSFTLEAYVLGAVPPYSMLLGSKLVGSLVASREIRTAFRQRYAENTGLISKVKKKPHLVLATTTSAFGRFSVYNRLRLPDMVEFVNIGFTEGWGHFLVTDEIFGQVRLMLKAQGDPYYDNYRYGQGPSWRFRALRKACELLDIDRDLLRHGIKREAYTVPLAKNWRQILLGSENIPEGFDDNCSQIGVAAVKRWVIPRAERCSEWAKWRREDTWVDLTTYARPLGNKEMQMFIGLD